MFSCGTGLDFVEFSQLLSRSPSSPSEVSETESGVARALFVSHLLKVSDLAASFQQDLSRQFYRARADRTWLTRTALARLIFKSCGG